MGCHDRMSARGTSMAANGSAPVDIVGVIADVKREYDQYFLSTECCVFGIDEAEHTALGSEFEIRPREFHNKAERY